MTNYNEYNDYELVFLAQEENEDAVNIIYKKYKPIIVKKSKLAIYSTKNSGSEINDVMQEAYLGLEEAIRNFSQNDEATFYTFANLCIDRKISNYIRKMANKKNILLNEAIFIDENMENYLKDTTDIENNLIRKVMKEEIINKIYDKFTTLEKDVYNLLIDGYSLAEISSKLDKDIKSIYNTIDRIKQKVKKYRDENDN